MNIAAIIAAFIKATGAHIDASEVERMINQVRGVVAVLPAWLDNARATMRDYQDQLTAIKDGQKTISVRLENLERNGAHGTCNCNCQSVGSGNAAD